MLSVMILYNNDNNAYCSAVNVKVLRQESIIQLNKYILRYTRTL